MARHRKVTMENLTDEIRLALEEYGEDVSDTLRDSTKIIAQKGAQAIKNSANVIFPKATVLDNGRYGSGWTYKVDYQRLKTTATIYNSKYPWLPHLLEHDHAMRQGGRYYAVNENHNNVHIQPVAEQVEKEYLALVERKLSS